MQRRKGDEPAPIHGSALLEKQGMLRTDGESAVEGAERRATISTQRVDSGQIQVVLRFVGFQLDRALAQPPPLLQSS